MKMTLDHDLAVEAKALVVLAFRNGPIEDLHTGRPCTVCSGKPEVSHISDEEMQAVMKSAVDTLYRLLWQRDCDPAAYNESLAFGRRQTTHWDAPELKKPKRKDRVPYDLSYEEILMFKELSPFLRQRAVLLTVTHLEEDQLRVNVIPKKLKDGENAALTTPLSVIGTAEELDRELPSTIVSFVASHLLLKNSLEKA